MDIQQLIVLTFVAVAAVYLIRRLWREARGMAEGDGCAGCGGACGKPAQAPSGVRTPPQATPLVSLSAPPPRRLKPPTATQAPSFNPPREP